MLQEKNYTLAAASTVSERVEQYKTFFNNVLNAEISLTYDEGNNIFWVDENKSVGLDIVTSSSSVYMRSRYVYSNPQTIGSKFISTSPTYSKAVEIHYHVSKNKNVLFIGEYLTGNSYFTNLYIFAKAQSGVWYIIYNSEITTPENGLCDIQTTVPVNTNLPFIASKAVAPDGSEFLELYKMIYATSFNWTSTCVVFDGIPNRVVTTTSNSSTDAQLPAFAFPVSEN